MKTRYFYAIILLFVSFYSNASSPVKTFSNSEIKSSLFGLFGG